MLATALQRLKIAQGKASATPTSCLLTIETSVSKGRVPMRETGLVEQPIELFFGLTEEPMYSIALSLVATLECGQGRTQSGGFEGSTPPHWSVD